MLMRKDGVAGFFVDIPALLAIIIGISIFTFSLYSAHASYLERRGSEDMARRLDSFVTDFRSNDYLTSSPGVFTGEVLSNLNITHIKDIYSPEALRFHYRIEFEDNSNYAHSYTTSLETMNTPSEQDIFAKSSSVIITEGSGSAHLAKLTIYIWRLN